MKALKFRKFDIICKDQIYHPHQLSKLDIDYRGISQETYMYISTCFSNLQRLEVGYWGTVLESAMLGKLNLYSLQITIHRKNMTFSITILDDNKTNLYVTVYGIEYFKNYDNADTYDLIKPTSSPSLKMLGNVSPFFSGSITTLFINKHLAY